MSRRTARLQHHDAARPRSGGPHPKIAASSSSLMGPASHFGIIAAEEADAAVDVVADSSREDDALVGSKAPRRRSGNHSPGGIVGHDIPSAARWREAGDVAGLDEGFGRAACRRAGPGIDDGRDSHSALGRDLPGVVIDLPEGPWRDSHVHDDLDREAVTTPRSSYRCR